MPPREGEMRFQGVVLQTSCFASLVLMIQKRVVLALMTSVPFGSVSLPLWEEPRGEGLPPNGV